VRELRGEHADDDPDRDAEEDQPIERDLGCPEHEVEGPRLGVLDDERHEVGGDRDERRDPHPNSDVGVAARALDPVAVAPQH
jgi:hypothetical protein